MYSICFVSTIEDFADGRTARRCVWQYLWSVQWKLVTFCSRLDIDCISFLSSAKLRAKWRWTVTLVLATVFFSPPPDIW